MGWPDAYASTAEMAAVTGLPQPVAINLRHFPIDEFLSRDDRALVDNAARVVTILDEEYPSLLKSIPDAPVVLYVIGRLPKNADVCLGVVGARHASLYGVEMAERFALELSERGVWVISGLAKGVDAAAHRGALKAGGLTIGVLGCGLDVVYPSENKELYRRMQTMAQAGGEAAIISEFPFATLPAPFNFPRRNRIVSGLSMGVLVVECSLRSGALITAAFALEQGREVFALPGRADSRLSLGPHSLIKQGAKLTLTVDDILEELPVVRPNADHLKRRNQGEEIGMEKLSEDEQLVVQCLKGGDTTLEALEERTGRSPALLMGPLLTLQLRKMVRELPGKFYCLRDDS